MSTKIAVEVFVDRNHMITDGQTSSNKTESSFRYLKPVLLLCGLSLKPKHSRLLLITRNLLGHFLWSTNKKKNMLTHFLYLKLLSTPFNLREIHSKWFFSTITDTTPLLLYVCILYCSVCYSWASRLRLFFLYSIYCCFYILKSQSRDYKLALAIHLSVQQCSLASNCLFTNKQ